MRRYATGAGTGGMEKGIGRDSKKKPESVKMRRSPAYIEKGILAGDSFPERMSEYESEIGGIAATGFADTGGNPGTDGGTECRI